MDDFAFLGGNLALDFVNTAKMRRGQGVDLLATATDFERWWLKAAHHHVVRDEALRYDWTEATMAAAKHLRTHLRRLFESTIDGTVEASSLAVLNESLSRGSLSVQAVGGQLRPAFHGRDWADDPLVFLANAAYELLTQRELQRLRHCQSDQCVLLFYDTSKSATRHWCSPACLNRARSRTNYQKRQSQRPS